MAFERWHLVWLPGDISKNHNFFVSRDIDARSCGYDSTRRTTSEIRGPVKIVRWGKKLLAKKTFWGPV